MCTKINTKTIGKILKKIKNKAIIEILLKRLQKSKELDKIIIACTKNPNDQKIIKFCKKNKIKYYAGSENNVLNRFFNAAKKYNISNIVRITSDCPLVDGKLVDELIIQYKQKNCDYASNVIDPSFPDGLDVEVFSYNALKERNNKSVDKNEQEHVTTNLKINKKFKKFNLKLKKNFSKIRITLDNNYDLYIINKVFKKFNYNFNISYKHILKLCEMKNNFFEKNSDVKRNQDINIGQKFWIRAKNIIPGGTMLFSKNPDLQLPKLWPSYFSKSKKSYLWDLNGNRYTDVLSMGIGTNTLGYANKFVDKQVTRVIGEGNMSSLNSVDEIYLAEKLIEIHPWAQMVRFTRSGGEANAVAIRIARATTGKDKIAICGYHGWHDWYLSSNLSNPKNLDEYLLKNLKVSGVPNQLKNTTFPFKYNDIESLNKLISKENIGVIKMEVERNIKPNINFLKKVRKIATQKKIILIFDECTSGFRETYGGIHLKYNIYPDIAIFGKALGNGYAINAIIGKREVMESVNSTFISSTFWTERIGSVAALETLKQMELQQSWKKLVSIGKKIKSRWYELKTIHNLKINISNGLDTIPSFNFQSHKNNAYKTFITQEMLSHKMFASNVVYTSITHDKNILNKYFEKLNIIFRKINLCENQRENIYDLLKTDECITGFRNKK
jgi:glutamate-1-semialdehyde aminotransferase/spore coat polysaccharide biosynthesis protein SpsF (cytidylyltransferase family)